MPLTNLLPIDRNPASIVLNTMPIPARPYNFDVEFFVRGLNKDVQKFHYYVTDADKPKFDFNYDEINQYGFRYPLLTGIRYADLNMTILDDSDNKSLSFLYAYLNGVMQKNPEKAKKNTKAPNLLQKAAQYIGLIKENQQQPDTRFTNSKVLPVLETDPYLANIRALGDGVGTGVIIQEIKLHQYVSFGIDGSAKGRIRTWTFTDPQLTNIDMQALSTTDDEIGKFMLSFNYKNVSFSLDTKDYPDTPFELLRTAAYADLIEGGLTLPAKGYLKAATNIGTQLAVNALNTTVLPGISGGGGGLAIGSSAVAKSTTGGVISASIPKVDNEKNKNGYVSPKQEPLPQTNLAKPAPAPTAQQSKLEKIN